MSKYTPVARTAWYPDREDPVFVRILFKSCRGIKYNYKHLVAYVVRIYTIVTIAESTLQIYKVLL